MLGCSNEEKTNTYTSSSLVGEIILNQESVNPEEKLVLIEISSLKNETIFVQHAVEYQYILSKNGDDETFNFNVSQLGLEKKYSELYSIKSGEKVLLEIPSMFLLENGNYSVQLEITFLVDGSYEAMIIEHLNVTIK